MKIENLKKIDKIAILGYGKEGKSTLYFLLKIGINKEKITILDKNNIFSQELKNINIIYGEKYLNNLGDFNLIFKSPGISPYDEKIAKYRDKLTSQSEIFFDNYKGKVIGVTATKGKSTTSTLIYETLKLAGYKVKLVGNIGNPVFDEIDLLNKEKFDFIIFELSSYMLEMFQPKCFIAVLGNIYTDHLDWHGNSFENYKKAKLNIAIKSENIVIRDEFKDSIKNNDNVKTFGLSGNYFYKDGNFYIGEKIVFDDKDILLKGEHNMINICSILGVLDIIERSIYGILENDILIKDTINRVSTIKSLKNILKSFSGLPHRMQNLGTFNGINFIDDAISTTPESTIEAIKTFGKNIGTIFLGGTDRGYDFKNLIEYLEKYKIENIVLFPETGKRILEELKKDLNFYKNLNLLETSSMKEAVDFSFNNTKSGKICLLSTASPSYFLWKNFEEKGDLFKEEIKNYTN